MYIIEITPKENKYEIIFDNIDYDNFDFLVTSYVNKLMKFENVIHFVENIKDSKIKIGYHLVKVNDNEIHLIEKKLVNDIGYIWNSQHFEYILIKKFILANKKSKKFTKPIDNIEIYVPNIKQGSNNLIIGRRVSGKTTLVMDLLRKTDYDKIIIVSPTEKTNIEYSKKFKNCKIFNSIKDFEFDDLNLNKNICVVFDDCFSSSLKLNETNLLEKIMFNSHITLFIANPFINFQPKFRLNFHQMFMLNDDMISNKKKLYDHYFGKFKKFKTFNDIFDQITKNYGAIIIDNDGNIQKYRVNNDNN